MRVWDDSGCGVGPFSLVHMVMDSSGGSGDATLMNVGAGEYETVAASQTAQTLGPTGATGDYISGILVTPATTSPGAIALLDGATSITVFTGGATSVSNLVPFLFRSA